MALFDEFRAVLFMLRCISDGWGMVQGIVRSGTNPCPDKGLAAEGRTRPPGRPQWADFDSRRATVATLGAIYVSLVDPRRKGGEVQSL